MTGKNIGDLLNARGRHLGLVPGRLRTDHGLRRPPARTRSAAPRTPTSAAPPSADYSAAPLPVRVLRVDVEPAPPAADVDGRRSGHDRPGQPHYDLTDFNAALDRRQPAGRQLPEGAGVPGRPRGLLRPDRRAALPGLDDQRDPEVEVLGQHRDRHRLRRLRRLVRPRRPRRCSTPRTTRPTTRPICTSAIVSSGVAGGYLDRCGPGPRLPLLVISPWSKTNYVDHTPVEQASITEVHRGQLAHRPDRRTARSTRRAGRINWMFDFTHPNGKQVLLKPTARSPRSRTCARRSACRTAEPPAVPRCTPHRSAPREGYPSRGADAWWGSAAAQATMARVSTDPTTDREPYPYDAPASEALFDARPGGDPRRGQLPGPGVPRGRRHAAVHGVARRARG